MSYIPNGRTDETYNEKYLNEIDKEFLHGFDWAVENAVDVFFDNLDFIDDEPLEYDLKAELKECARENYTMEYTFPEYHTEERTTETHGELMRMKLLEWIEMERNQLITSMIDRMADDEYEAIKEKVDGQAEGKVG